MSKAQREIALSVEQLLAFALYRYVRERHPKFDEEDAEVMATMLLEGIDSTLHEFRPRRAPFVGNHRPPRRHE